MLLALISLVGFIAWLGSSGRRRRRQLRGRDTLRQSAVATASDGSIDGDDYDFGFDGGTNAESCDGGGFDAGGFDGGGCDGGGGGGD